MGSAMRDWEMPPAATQVALAPIHVARLSNAMACGQNITFPEDPRPGLTGEVFRSSVSHRMQGWRLGALRLLS